MNNGLPSLEEMLDDLAKTNGGKQFIKNLEIFLSVDSTNYRPSRDKSDELAE